MNVVVLAMCVGSAAVWVRSEFRYDYLSWCNGEGDGFVWIAQKGGLVFARVSTASGKEYPGWWFSTASENRYWFEIESALADMPEPILGFNMSRQLVHRPGYTVWWIVVVPMWFVTAVFGVVPTGCVVRWMRFRRRMRAGLCRVCGYDLRATPARCPECGAVADGSRQ
jgi:hypothetical protein